MSTFKKVISIVLCIAMLAGSVSVLGGLATPEAKAAEGTSKVDSLASLDAAYDNYVYFGTEFYEIDITKNADGTLGAASNHVLTDYYVDAGQYLEARLYLKSDMYLGEGTFFFLYENDFFDVKQLTNAVPANPNGYTQGQAGGVNANHPAYKVNKIKGMQTSENAYSQNWMKQKTGYTQAELESWDYSSIVTAFTDNGQNQAYLFNSDEYIFSWFVKVRDDVTDGNTGSTFTKPGFWKCDDYDPEVAKQSGWNGRQGNFTSKVRPAGATADDDFNTLLTDTKNAYLNYGVYEHVFFEDLEHTFTVGKNPNAGTGTVTKYTVTFLENDDTEISATEYAANAEVKVPDEVENQLGWADTATGKLVDLEGYVATKKATFKRVLTTDEFDITIDLAGGTVDEAALPENAKVENGSLIVKAGLGDEIDLSTLPTPEKTGYTGSWDPATVTLDSIKGASASVKWTAKTFTATFYNAKGDAEPIDTVSVAYNGTVTTRNTIAPEGKKFAGWADAETDELVSAASIKYTYDSDKSFYATWTAYDSSIIIMVRDYEAGNGWKVGATSYNDAGKTLSKANTQALLEKAAASIDATIGTLQGTDMIYIYDNAETEGTLVDTSSGFKFNGETTYYLCTTLDFNVTWKVPVYDAENDTFSGYTETTSTASTGAVANIYTVNVKTTADTTPPAGYTFKGWKLESTGEAVEYNATAGVTLDASFARDVVFVAEFAETEYEIVFDMQNGSADGKLTSDKTFKKGDAVDFEGATFMNGFDKESALPIIGVENKDQPKPFIGRYGYKFTGWKLGTGADAADVTFPIDELTYEMIAEYANGTTITVYGQWEALEYELRFFYATPETDMSAAMADRTYAEPIVVKYKTGETINRNLDAETLAKINENSPEGYYFLQWRKLDGSTIESKMPAGGLDLYASYVTKSILIYVDYNVDKFDADGNKLGLKDTMQTTPFLTNNPVSYGDDIETLGDAEADIPMGVGTMVKRAIITEGDKPGVNYEVVSWNVYHVEDGKDIYDTANWIPGINDEGTSNAYSTIIYQPEWKSHGEFFFRVYGTDGKIYMALGKNFKLYYWTNNYVSNRKDAAVNHDPENLVILLYKIAFETEGGLTMRFDPIYAPKSMFTWDAFVGLMGALGNLIKGLF